MGDLMDAITKWINGDKDAPQVGVDVAISDRAIIKIVGSILLTGIFLIVFARVMKKEG
jgi:hypothetical protein